MNLSGAWRAVCFCFVSWNSYYDLKSTCGVLKHQELYLRFHYSEKRMNFLLRISKMALQHKQVHWEGGVVPQIRSRSGESDDTCNYAAATVPAGNNGLLVTQPLVYRHISLSKSTAEAVHGLLSASKWLAFGGWWRGKLTFQNEIP